LSPRITVFEEIGKIAGALSYVHAIVPVNIFGLAHHCSRFQTQRTRAEETLHRETPTPGFTHNNWFHQRIVDLFQLASADADAMLVNIDSLRDTLPAVAAETHLPHEAHEYRIRRLSPFAIISRVIGTLMGWFTQRRLDNLRDRLDEVQDQQHRLLHVQAVQLQRLEEIETAVQQLYSSLKQGHTAWINYSSLDYAHSQLRANLQKLIRALQATHYRRLSIDLLPSDTLKRLFDAASRKARLHHHQLLLCHPSDLLQIETSIETSYVQDRHDVHLILHIPMAPVRFTAAAVSAETISVALHRDAHAHACSRPSNSGHFGQCRPPIH
jgi:hypothetical protein